MPDENSEVKDIQSENLQEEHNPDETKRRIKPVIEEVVTDTPAKAEDKGGTKAEEVKETKEETKKEEAAPVYEKSSETMPETPGEEAKSDLKLFILVAVITAVVVAALAGGIYVYITGTKNLSGGPTAMPTATIPPEASPSASPTSSPSAGLKLKDYSLQVLNGSGKIGEAGNAKTLLETTGFKVGSTGNAATFNFTDTIIQAKNSVPASVVSAAKSALSGTYSVKVGDSLDPSSDFDIVITVGSK